MQAGVLMATAPRRIPGGKNKIPGASSARIPGQGAAVGGALTRFRPQPTSAAYANLHRVQVRDSYGRFGGATGFAWQGLARVNANLLGWEQLLEGSIEEAAQRLADDMVAYAKENHPWENDTFRAEEGLQAIVTKEPNNQFSIWLGHGDDVYYGVWLEVRHGGRFAIILPTLLHFAPQLGAYLKAGG